VSSCGAFLGAHTSVSTMMDVAGRQKNATVAHCSLPWRAAHQSTWMCVLVEATTDIAELGDMLRRLRATDSNFRVFGSQAHAYRLRPTLSESDLAAFESTNRIRLPDDYRRFLAIICNGEAGPYYGLAPLFAGSRDLSRPFPLTMATNELTDADCERPNSLTTRACWRFATRGAPSPPIWWSTGLPTARSGKVARICTQPA